jgi:peptidoglycan/LPS O-acetylase OafA/YrhL
LGIAVYRIPGFMTGRHKTAIAILIAFSLFYWWFDTAGGFFELINYPSPTIEGAAYATLIAYYDRSFKFHNSGYAGFLAMIGSVSYAIYLIHFFVYKEMAIYINTHIMSIKNFCVSLLWSVPCFLITVIVAQICTRFVQEPFNGYRRKYVYDQHAALERGGPVINEAAA